jgi:hypothetical protein
MDEVSFFQWLASTWLGVAMRDVGWAFPAAEILHFLGLCLLFGSLLVVDLRVLGLGGAPLDAVLRFSRFAMIGLGINVVTGVAFVCSDPENYWSNPAFRWKLLLLLIGALNAVGFEVLRRQDLLASGGARLAAKGMAAASLTCWLLVIALGRLLPYTSSSLG